VIATPVAAVVPGTAAIHDFEFILFVQNTAFIMQTGVDREVFSTEGRGLPLNQNL
jgi:hypothetical protein